MSYILIDYITCESKLVDDMEECRQYMDHQGYDANDAESLQVWPLGATKPSKLTINTSVTLKD